MLAREEERVAMITVFACNEGKDIMFGIREDGTNWGWGRSFKVI
jgi:hypothetical protein